MKIDWLNIYNELLKEPYQWHPEQTATTALCQIWALLMQEGTWTTATKESLEAYAKRKQAENAKKAPLAR